MVGGNARKILWSHLAIYSLIAFIAHKISPYVFGHTEFKGDTFAGVVAWLLNGTSLMVVVPLLVVSLLINERSLSVLGFISVAFSAVVLGAAISGFVFPFGSDWLVPQKTDAAIAVDFSDALRLSLMASAIMLPLLLARLEFYFGNGAKSR